MRRIDCRLGLPPEVALRDLAQRMGAGVRGDNAEGGGFRVSLAFTPASA